MIIREATLSSQASKEMLRLTRIEQAELKPMRRSNSVDSLSPKSRFLNAMNTIPITPGVRYNTIIGDRIDCATFVGLVTVDTRPRVEKQPR